MNEGLEEESQVKNTCVIRAFTWHHHQTTGRMQLVNSKIHSQTGHTGGFSLWGN
ncbi:MAG: HNH endonuclease [Bacteroidota bacterium]